MIDISGGDVIYFDRRPVGFITVPNGSLRADFEEELNGESESTVDELRSELNATEEERDEADEKIDSALEYLKNIDEPDIAVLVEILS